LTPYNVVVLTVASAIVAGILLAFAFYTLKPHEAPLSFDTIREVALAASEMREFRLPKPAIVEGFTAGLRIGEVRIPATRVQLTWECPSPVYVENYGSWILWSNLTHAGLNSSVYVKDEESILRIYFFAKGGDRVFRLDYRATELVFEAVLADSTVFFDGAQVYSFSGWREVKVYRVRVGG